MKQMVFQVRKPAVLKVSICELRKVLCERAVEKGKPVVTTKLQNLNSPAGAKTWFLLT